MVDIKHKHCIFEGCNKQPIFNYPDQTKGLYCLAHRKEGTIDVVNKKCIFEGCIKQPNFNYPNEKNAIYCLLHKLPTMINVKLKKCMFEECTKRPLFNYPDQTKGLYCLLHKLPTMINVKSKKCIFKKCKNNAMYGEPNKRMMWCKEHKQPHHTIASLEMKCSVEVCDNVYDFIVENKKYCNEHTPNNNFKIILKRKRKRDDLEESSEFVCNQRQHKKSG